MVVAAERVGEMCLFFVAAFADAIKKAAFQVNICFRLQVQTWISNFKCVGKEMGRLRLHPPILRLKHFSLISVLKKMKMCA